MNVHDATETAYKNGYEAGKEDSIKNGFAKLVPNDPVKHPSHYTQGKIECIDFILDKELNFPLGNAIKYIIRAGHKKSEGMSDQDKAIQDLEKAKQYIDFQIEHLRGER